MHICAGKLTIIVSDNGLSPGWRQPIIWTNAGILLFGPLGTNISEILLEIHTFSFKKMHLKMSSAKRRPFRLGLNVLINANTNIMGNMSNVKAIWPQPSTLWPLTLMIGSFSIKSHTNNIHTIKIFIQWFNIKFYWLHIYEILHLAPQIWPQQNSA